MLTNQLVVVAQPFQTMERVFEFSLVREPKWQAKESR